MATTPFRQRMVWFAIVVALLLGVVVGWKSYQRRSLQAQWDREFELMKQGAIEMSKGIGSPKKAMEEVGDPFAPTSGGAKRTAGKEKSR